MSGGCDGGYGDGSGECEMVIETTTLKDTHGARSADKHGKPRVLAEKKTTDVRQNNARKRLLESIHLTPLEKRVYAALALVPKGKVTTYGELARAAGIANGQRAVGRIMNKNPYPVIIPCHRVVMSTGDVGGYAHGKMIKEHMLASEGVLVRRGKIADMGHAMHRFDSPRA